MCSSWRNSTRGLQTVDLSWIQAHDAPPPTEFVSFTLELISDTLYRMLIQVGIYSEGVDIDAPAWTFGICPGASVLEELKQLITAALVTFSATIAVLMVRGHYQRGDEVIRKGKFLLSLADSMSILTLLRNRPHFTFWRK